MNNSIIKYKFAVIALFMTVICGVEAFASAPWTVNPSDYRYDMSLYIDLAFADDGVDMSGYEVGVFCGDECRGIAEILSLSDGTSCFYVRVRSNQESGETMTFRYYDEDTQSEHSVENVSFEFESNGLLGYPSSPYVFSIKDEYEIVISAGDGGSVDYTGGNITNGTIVTVTATPNEGYSFVQWSDGNTDNPRNITVSEDLTIKAQFSVNSYVLTYIVDGEIYEESEVIYGSAIEAIEEPEKEGYTFSGWRAIPETMPAEDVTVTGSFSINSYTITFVVDGEVIESQTLEYGAKIVAPEVVEKEGYTFSGWSEIPEVMPAEDLEITGTYNVNQYTLTYVVDEETYQEELVDYGTVLVAIEEPEKEGYTFSGWSEMPETMPAEDVTVTGSFSINSYTISFIVEGDILETQTLEYGAEIVAPEAPEIEDYYFVEWEGLPETMPAEDLEVEAVYASIANIEFKNYNNTSTETVEVLAYESYVEAQIVNSLELPIHIQLDPRDAEYNSDSEGVKLMKFNQELNGNPMDEDGNVDGYIYNCSVVPVGRAGLFSVIPLDSEGNTLDASVITNGVWGIYINAKAFTSGSAGCNSCLIAWQVTGSSSIADAAVADDAMVDIYNLQGMCVAKSVNASTINTLPNGVYIVKGKKVLKK